MENREEVYIYLSWRNERVADTNKISFLHGFEQDNKSKIQP